MNFLLKEKDIIKTYLAASLTADFFRMRDEGIFGSTPPWAIVTPLRSLFKSSSFLITNWRCLGLILVFLLSRAALPTNSKTSAVRYSKTAGK